MTNNNPNPKRRFSTLVELLIGMALLSLLITVLMSAYGMLSELNRKTTQARDNAFTTRYTQLRLTSIFSKITPPTENTKCFFFTETENNPSSPAIGQSLVFSFHNEATIFPEFSGTVLAKLYITQDGKVTLSVWPEPKGKVDQESQWPPPMMDEILAENILQMGFRFYIPPEPTLAIGDTETVKTGKGPEDKFGTTWSQDWKELPAVVVVILNDKSGIHREIALPIPKGQKLINYPY